MAKMLRWERAWRHFTDEFLEIRKYRQNQSYSKQRWRRQGREADAAYWSLVRIAKELGIVVYLKGDLGESHDAFGETFTVGGHWDSRDGAIRLTHRSLPIITHELAHAVDEILGHRYYPSSSGELVACGAGYLLTCASSGQRSPVADIVYAKRQGATPRDLKENEDRIFTVFREAATLVNVPCD